MMLRGESRNSLWKQTLSHSFHLAILTVLNNSRLLYYIILSWLRLPVILLLVLQTWQYWTFLTMTYILYTPKHSQVWVVCSPWNCGAMILWCYQTMCSVVCQICLNSTSVPMISAPLINSPWLDWPILLSSRWRIWRSHSSTQMPSWTCLSWRSSMATALGRMMMMASPQDSPALHHIYKKH